MQKIQQNEISPVRSPVPSQKTVSSANLGSLSLVISSVVLAGVGQLVFKAALRSTGELNLSLEMYLWFLSNPLLLLGLGIYGLSAMLWLLTLMRAELSFAYCFLSLSYLIVILGGGLLFHEEISATRLSGLVLIIVGIFIIARSEAHRQR